MSEKFNGYTNWATWNVCLWAHNEELIYKCLRQTAKNNSTKDMQDGFNLIFDGKTPDMDSINEMHDVNWQEVLESFQEDMEV